jgi:hypothetical protein
MIKRKSQSSTERKQAKQDAGLVSSHYPGVERIIISMTYSQKGSNPIHRTMNFYPESYASVRVNCLSNDCVDGGFDLTRIIISMIRNQNKKIKGKLDCDDNGSRTDHSNIAYEIAIQYS